jgi:hypothetical protein
LDKSAVISIAQNPLFIPTEESNDGGKPGVEVVKERTNEVLLRGFRPSKSLALYFHIFVSA